MKKLFTFLTMLVIGISGMWADGITPGTFKIVEATTGKFLFSSSQFGPQNWNSYVGIADDDTKIWKIEESGTNFIIRDNSVPAKFLGEGNNSDRGIAFNDITSQQEYRFDYAGDNAYYIYNVTRSKWMCINSYNNNTQLGFSSNESERAKFRVLQPWTVNVSTTSSITVEYTGTDYFRNNSASNGGIFLFDVGVTPDDSKFTCNTDGNVALGVSVDAEAKSICLKLPFTPTTITDGNFSNDTKYYLMTLRTRYIGGWNESKFPGSNSLPDKVQMSDMWAFVGNNTDGFNIFNREQGATYAVGLATTPTSGTGNWGRVAAASAQKFVLQQNKGRSGNIVQTADRDNNKNLAVFNFREKTAGTYINYISDGLGYWKDDTQAPGEVGCDLVFYEVEEYDIVVSGHTDGRVVVNGCEYNNGDKFYYPKNTEFIPTAKAVTYFAGEISINGNTISLVYTETPNREITVPSGSNGYIGGITTIGESEWKTKEYWTLQDSWNNNGPGCPNSTMWSPIYLKDITGGTVPTLEGWNFRMTADHSTYKIASVGKIQGGQDAYITLKNNSVVTMNFGNGHTFPLKVNLGEGDNNILNFNMSNGYKHLNCAQNECTGQITVNYGSVSKNTGREFNASGSGSINELILNATLTDPTRINTVEEIPLVTYTSGVSSATVTCDISGTGWTRIDDKDNLEAQTAAGKYYSVETTSSGVTLYTFRQAIYHVAEGTTVSLSAITNYSSYEEFHVPSGSTLNIDVADFDLTRVYGLGNVVLDADVTLSGGKSTVATGKLIINEGKTLNIGAGDTETNSIANFTSIDLAGTIKHRNSKDTWNNITVPTGKTGKIFAYDMGNDADGFILAGTTTLNGNLTICNRYNCLMKVDELYGSGTLKICGTDNGDFKDDGTTSSQNATINVWNSPDFTGTIHGNNSNASVIINRTLANCTIKANHGSLKLADGAYLDGVILDGTKRIQTSGTVTIMNLAGNNLSSTTNDYALVGTGTINFEGNCDFTKTSDNTDCNCAKIGYHNGSSIIIKSGANVKVTKISYDTGDNAAITVEGTLTATKLHGSVTLAEGSVTTLSEATPFNEGAVSVTGDATLNLTGTNVTLSQDITIASGKTLNIGGGESLADISLTGAFTGDGALNISTDDLADKLGENESCTLINVTGSYNASSLTINGHENVTVGDYDYYISYNDNAIILSRRYYSRNVTSGNFGSICIPNGALVSQMTGVAKVLEVTEITTESVVMDEVDEMVAGVPYIFKSNDAAINLTLKGETVAEPNNSTQNYLVGNFEPTGVPNSNSDADYNYYILQSNQFKKVTSGTIKSGKNRCYLTVPVTSSSRQATLGIAVDDGGATGIDAINSLMNNDAEIYDLNGRRLNDLRKGINIVNGVKVIVK